MTRDDLIAFNGVSQPVAEWALDYGITAALIMDRLRAGKSLEYAITRPMRTKPGDRLPEREARQGSRPASPRKPTASDRCRQFGGIYPEHPMAVMMEYMGEFHSMAEWCRRFGLSRSTVGHRLRTGSSLHDALNRPARRMRARGVSSNLPASVGTGGGRPAQESTNIGISK